MVVVVLIASGAAICLRLYKAAEAAGPTVFERVVFSIRQQAGVMAALAGTVFAVLTALQTGKAIAIPGGTGTPTTGVPAFGTQRGDSQGAKAVTA